MRNLSVHEFEQDTGSYLAEVEAGQRLVLVRGGAAVAEIGPVSDGTLCDRASIAEERREAAIQRLDEIMREGIPLGGTPPSRDEMHDGR